MCLLSHLDLRVLINLFLFFLLFRGEIDRSMAAAEHREDSGSGVESFAENTTEKLQRHDSSSSSDSANEKSSPSAVKAAVYRLFGRQRPVHNVLGGGKRKCENSSLTILGFIFFSFSFFFVSLDCITDGNKIQ